MKSFTLENQCKLVLIDLHDSLNKTLEELSIVSYNVDDFFSFRENFREYSTSIFKTLENQFDDLTVEQEVELFEYISITRDQKSYIENLFNGWDSYSILLIAEHLREDILYFESKYSTK